LHRTLGCRFKMLIILLRSKKIEMALGHPLDQEEPSGGKTGNKKSRDCPF